MSTATLTCDHCTAKWEVARPGTDEVRDIFLLQAGTPDRHWCMACAIAAGWPWLVSEKGKAA